MAARKAKSRAPRLVGLALSTALAASGALTACGSDQPEKYDEDVYCVDKDGKVLPEDYCDDHDGRGNGYGFPGFIWIGSFGGGHGPGYQLPVGSRTSSVPYNDPVGREKVGLPRTGRVTGSGGLGGKVTRTRAGSSGKSGTKAGTSKGGGFGSAGHGGSGS